MRNYLTTSDIARLCDRTRAQVWNWAKNGLIPFQRVNRYGKHIRYPDSIEIRRWCQAKQRRDDSMDGFLAVIEGTVLEIFLRDRSANLEGVITREIWRQLLDSDDPDQLLKKWEQAKVEGRRDDLPHFSLAYVCRDIQAEVLRQLLDSKEPDQLVKKWARAIVNRRPDDLPRVP